MDGFLFFSFIMFIVHDMCSSCDFSVLFWTAGTLLLLDEVFYRNNQAHMVDYVVMVNHVLPTILLAGYFH